MRGRLVLLLLFVVASSASAQAAVDYERDVQPLLSERCGHCHGSREQKAGFRADAGTLLLAGGDSGAAVVVGQSDKSLLIQAVLGTAKFARMPLEEEPLTDAQIALLREWIDAGAKFPANEIIVPAAQVTSSHWSFQPLQRPAVPDIRGAFIQNPVDAFIVQKLHAVSLTPAAAADRRTLIRRLYLDLLGLVPPPSEVESFLADSGPDAYERLVERLLASPHYGERWGRHWLDAARYADSNGFTIDGPRDMWNYRDWVISTLNADMPFDQFTIDQLAGDMHGKPTVEQRIATGFHRNTLANEEGGTDDEQFRDEAIIDRVNTTGTVWLGLTIGCAQCHDHKYDPISQRDYYRLFAILNNTVDNNDAAGQAPKISLPSPEQTQQQQELQGALNLARKQLREREVALEAGRATWELELTRNLPPPHWTVVDALPVSSAGQSFEKLAAGAYLVRSPSRPDHDTYQVTLLGGEQPITAIRLETLTHPDLPQQGPGTVSNGNFVLSDVELLDAAGKPLPWKAAHADHSQEGYDVAGAIDGKPETGWAINVKQGSLNVPRTASFVLASPHSGGPLTFLMHQRRPANKQYLIGSFRVSVTSDQQVTNAASSELLAIVNTPADQRSDEQRKELAALQQQQDARWVELKQLEKQHQVALTALNKSIPTSLVMEELPQPRPTHIHLRGDFLSKGAQVQPGTPDVLPKLTNVERLTRLELAKWLVSDQQPLTARVTVNRIWQRFFGMGLVETENDFGLQGSVPTHPELLDWLALELMRQHWSIKELQRVIVLSATYRQSSHERPELRTIDPRNLLLGRQNRIRLEAEIVRDATLSACGLLTEKLYGPPVYPPQPEGIYVLTQNRKDWPEEQGSNRYLRSLYTYLWRSSPHPMFPTFDAPDGTTTCTRRNRSNTPLQALTLANDRGFVELAQGLAARVLREGPEYDAGKVRYAFDVALSRTPSEAEAVRLQTLLDSARSYYSELPEAARQAGGDKSIMAPSPAATEAAAWTAVCRVLVNLDEFYTRE